MADGVVYFSSDKLYAVNAQTGVKKWDFPQQYSFAPSSPMVVNKVVYSIDGFLRKLYAINAETGLLKWVYTGKSAISYSNPTVANGVVFFGDLEANLYAIDALSGIEKWVTKIPSISGRAYNIFSSPCVVASDGKIYHSAVSGIDNDYSCTHTIQINSPTGTSLCAGTSATLSASVSGGTGPFTYQWKGSTGNLTTTGQLAVNQTGIYTVDVADSQNCTSSASVTITQKPAPTTTISTTGLTTVPTGTSLSVAMSTSAIAGQTYQWFRDGTAITGASSSTYTGTQPGGYTVRVTGSNGCVATSAVRQLTVGLSLSASGSTTFCAGTSTTITVTGDWGIAPFTFRSQFDGGSLLSLTATTNVLRVTNATASVLSATVTDSQGWSTSITVPFVRLPAPTIAVSPTGSLTLAPGETVVLSASAVAGQTYQWLRNGLSISGATSANYVAGWPGSYSVLVNRDGCTGTSPGTQVFVPTTNQPVNWSISNNGIIIYKVWMLNSTTGWAVGVDGLIYRTTNGGTTWTVQPAGTTETLYGVWGLDANNVWAVGTGGTILKYNGSSWIAQTSGTTTALRSLWGSDANNVWAVGENGTILKFNGNSWVAQSSGAVSQILQGIWGSGPTNIWVVGSNKTLLRYDGASWTPQSLSAAVSLESVWGSDTNNVWVVGIGGTIFKYDGSSWVKQTSGSTQTLNNVWGVNANTIWAVGTTGTILRYNGTSWGSQPASTTQNLLCVWGSDANNVWAVGQVGTIVRYNGTTWSTQLADDAITENLFGVWGADASNIWAVGNPGAGNIARYNGRNWVSQNSNLTVFLWQIWGLNTSNIWAVGGGGRIARFNGSTWTSEAVSANGVSQTLRGVWGSDASNVWAVGGNGGVMFRYNGSSWVNQPSSTTASLWGIWGSSANAIWAVGDNGTILRYNGTAWQTQPSSTTNVLLSVWGSDPNNIWAVGTNGTILRYNGTTWITQPSGTTNTLRGVSGFDANNVWAVGDNGTILRYNGTSWQRQPSPTTRSLYSVCMVDGTGWAVGIGGVIITTVPPGPLVSTNGSTSFCAGASTTLAAAVTDGTAPFVYQWWQNGKPTGTNSPTLVVAAAGSYSLSITDSRGLVGTSLSSTVIQKPNPVVPIVVSDSLKLQPIKAVVLSTSAITGQTYQWLLNGVAIAGANTSSYTAIATGDYSLITTLDGCVASSVVRRVQGARVAAEPIGTGFNVTLSPNPTDGICRVEVENETGKTISLRVVTQNGQAIETWEVKPSERRQTRWVSLPAPGLYLLQAENGEGKLTRKIIRQ